MLEKNHRLEKDIFMAYNLKNIGVASVKMPE